jgi:hypothetical protein
LKLIIYPGTILGRFNLNWLVEFWFTVIPVLFADRYARLFNTLLNVKLTILPADKLTPNWYWTINEVFGV